MNYNFLIQILYEIAHCCTLFFLSKMYLLISKSASRKVRGSAMSCYVAVTIRVTGFTDSKIKSEGQ